MDSENTLRRYLNEAATASIDEARQETIFYRQEVSQLSFALREVSAECTQLRNELSHTRHERQVAFDERDAQTKEKGEAQTTAENLKQQVSEMAALLETERKEKIAGEERLKALKAELANAIGERDAQTKEKGEVREEAELTLLQLHQVQEELEHYFLKSRGADQLAAAQQDQLLRAQALMARLLPEASALAQAQRVAVEVLPPSPPAAPVQTEALLNSYAASLRRASALLQRSIRG